MAVEVVNDAYVEVAAVDLSDHLVKALVNDGQETRDVTAHGNTVRTFRAGLGTPRFEFTFHNDAAAGSVEPTIRGLIGVNSTGYNFFVKKVSSNPASADNPRYEMVGIIDGDISVMDDEVGEVPQLVAAIVPYGAFTVITTATT